MRSIWTTPPGSSSLGWRRAVRKLIVSFLVGALSVGMAWAGTGLIPVSDQGATATGDAPARPGAAAPQAEEAPAAAPSIDLAGGQLLAGAVKVSLRPRPDDYGGTWVHAEESTQEARDTAKAQCETHDNPSFETLAHVPDFRVRWAENPNCIYMGGYSIGPANSIVDWDDEYGLWSRSIAMSDGSDTVVLTLIDAVYWEAHYNNLCDGCGFLDLAEQLSQETGLPPESFVFASTHSHTAMDFIGGWGAVPDWYMKQATDALLTSTKSAIASMEPAVLETGEVIARRFNAERRDFYRSAEDDALSWFRLIAASDQPRPEVCTPPGNGDGNGPPEGVPATKCEPPAPGRAIATVGAYAAHPVTADEGTGIGDADFPAVFAKRVEEAFGGTGMFLQTGLGNMSPRGDKIEMGNGLASLVPPMGTGTPVADPDVRVARALWDQPVTNVPLGSLGVGGFFDRTFNQAPAAVDEGKGPENTRCKSASPVSVRTSVTAAKVGSLWITGGPGELFSNLTNTIEEKNPGGVTLALGLVNDGLGYIVQSFETDHVGRQAVGFVGEGNPNDLDDSLPDQPVGLSEYEDAYSIDHCFGDAVLEKTLGLLGEL